MNFHHQIIEWNELIINIRQFIKLYNVDEKKSIQFLSMTNKNFPEQNKFYIYKQNKREIY